MGVYRKEQSPLSAFSVRCIANFFVNNKIRNPMELLDIVDRIIYIL